MTYEELYLMLPEGRRRELHDLVVELGSSPEVRLKPFKEAWQNAVDGAAIVVEGWLAENMRREIVGLPQDLLDKLLGE